MKILSKLTLAITLLLAVPLAVGCNKNGNGGPGGGGSSYISGYTGSVAIISQTDINPKQITNDDGTILLVLTEQQIENVQFTILDINSGMVRCLLVDKLCLHNLIQMLL